MRPFLFAAALLAAPVLASADEPTPEDRLRAALRQAVEQMRSAQDQAASAQASLSQAQTELTTTKQQLDAANAKITELSGKAQAKPEELAALQAQVRAAQAQSAALSGNLSRVQGQAAQATEAAQAKAAEAARAAAGAKSNYAAVETCKATNTKLIGVAEDILHLYERQDFRMILLKSYEPFLGLSRVKLQNMVQDYDDKIRDQEYVPLSK